jgi:hypothetical protein
MPTRCRRRSGTAWIPNSEIVGVPAQQIQASVAGMVFQRQSIHGWPSGTHRLEDTLIQEISGAAHDRKYPDRAAEFTTA